MMTPRAWCATSASCSVSGGVAEIHAAQFQSAYRAAWAACARRGDDAVPFPPDKRCYLVVDVSGSATALPLEPEGSEATPSRDRRRMAG